VTSRVGVLIAGTLGFWAVAFLPARFLFGETGVVYSLVALLLCLVPATLTMLWAHYRPVSTPQQQVLLVFGGTGLRLGFVLGGGLVLSALWPYFRVPPFWIWLLLFYMFTLTLEVLLLSKKQPAVKAE
jgi:hypothetical protein